MHGTAKSTTVRIRRRASGRQAVVLGWAMTLCGLATPAQAAVYYVDQNATGTPIDGLTWATAYRTIDAATTARPASEFWVAAAVYSGTTSGINVKPNNTFYGGFTSGMTSASQRNWVANPTVLDGGGVGRVIQKPDTGSLMMDGFVLRNGTNTTAGGAYIPGVGGDIEFRNCVFSNNIAGTSAGAIYINTSNLKHTFSNCTFTANKATAANGNGGAIMYNRGGGTGNFRDCVFAGNACGTGGSGGAIQEAGQTGNTNTFTSCVFTNNSAGQYGGALRMQARLTISNCDFVNNTAGYGGGAIYRAGTTSNHYQNCSFVGNSATGGGGTTGGGAIMDYPATGFRLDTAILNCTFLANSSTAPSPLNGVGGAIRAGSQGSSTSVLYVANCIFWGNTTTAGGTNINLGATSVANVSYCNVSTNSEAIKGGTKNFGSGLMDSDPQFASAVAPYDVHLKSTGGRWNPATSAWVQDAVKSPCIDAGDPTSAYALEPANNGDRINLGRYGNTVEASLTSASTPGGTVILLR